MTERLVVDSSALIAILEGEPEAEAMLAAILGAGTRLVGAVSLLEAGIVVAARRGPGGTLALDRLVERLALEPVALDAAQVLVARQAWTRFGKGRHRAGLNLGDCCTYALALEGDSPILCKGEDFPHTDAELALGG